MKHYDILIITKENIDLSPLSDINYLIINNGVSHELNIYNDKDNTFTYDYLITDDNNVLNNFDLLKDDDYYITNCFFQSTIDEIFIIGKLNKSNFDINHQISVIIEYLLGY